MLIIILGFCIYIITSILGQSEPAKCCVDKQFESLMGEIGGSLYSVSGKPVFTQLNGITKLYFDHYQKKSVMEGYLDKPDGSFTKSLTYFDYTQGKQYEVSNGGCTKQNLFIPYNGPCVPDHAIFLGSSFLGYGPSKIPIETWHYTVPNTDHTVKVSLTRDGCIPMVESFYGNWKLEGGTSVSMELNFIVTNFKPGLTKPDVFQMPSECFNATQIPNPIEMARAAR